MDGVEAVVAEAVAAGGVVWLEKKRFCVSSEYGGREG